MKLLSNASRHTSKSLNPISWTTSPRLQKYNNSRSPSLAVRNKTKNFWTSKMISRERKKSYQSISELLKWTTKISKILSKKNFLLWLKNKREFEMPMMKWSNSMILETWRGKRKQEWQFRLPLPARNKIWYNTEGNLNFNSNNNQKI